MNLHLDPYPGLLEIASHLAMDFLESIDLWDRVTLVTRLRTRIRVWAGARDIIVVCHALSWNSSPESADAMLPVTRHYVSLRGRLGCHQQLPDQLF